MAAQAARGRCINASTIASLPAVRALRNKATNSARASGVGPAIWARILLMSMM